MQLPPYLDSGDRIGIVAPARWVEKQDVERFINTLEEIGWKVETGSIYKRNDQFAGKDEEK